MSCDEAHWVVPPERESVPATRKLLRQFMAEHLHCDPSAAEVVMSELVANSVVHAGTEVRITVRSDGVSVIIAVGDDSEALPETPSPSAAETNGRGMLIVDSLSSEWGVESVHDDGKIVWCRVQTGSGSGSGPEGSDPGGRTGLGNSGAG